MAREINTVAGRSRPYQLPLDGLLISGLQVRVLPGSPLIPKAYRLSRSLPFCPLWGLLCGVHPEIRVVLSIAFIRQLREKGVIDARLAKWAEELQHARNLSAQASGERVSKQDGCLVGK